MSGITMPWGKHRGEPIESIPVGYCAWALEECGESLRRDPAVRRALVARVRAWLETIEPTSRPVPAAAVDRGFLHAAVRDWHRGLARRFHPDSGGSHEQMIVINEANDCLKKVLQL